MQKFNSEGVKFSYITAGKDFKLETLSKKAGNNDLPLIFWAHGWGQTHAGFSQLISALESLAGHIAVDFAGFGESDPPPDNWGTEQYGDAIAAWIKDKNLPPLIWIGHSFGARVGIQIAARHPELIKSMVFIGGAGLKRKRPIHKKIYIYLRIKLFKILKHLLPDGNLKKKIMKKFGSADYNNADDNLRKVFIRVVNEDLSDQAKKIQCPVALIYGSEDTETPPEFGRRYSQLIKNSKMFILEGQDHYSPLQNARHQVIKIVSNFIKESSS